MPTETALEKTLSEKIYYEDNVVKVTNVRVTCNHLTVPIEKIGSVNVNYKVEAFSLAVMCLVISASPFLFFPAITNDKLKVPVAGVAIILILASLLLLLLVYKSYVELIASVGGRAVKLFSVSMNRKPYIEKICDAISDAILDDKRYRDAKIAGNLEQTRFSSSDTMRLKKILDDYEEFQEMKKDFEKKRKKAQKS